jgi:hypothetical protein
MRRLFLFGSKRMSDAEKLEMEKDFDAIVSAIERMPLTEVDLRVLTVGLLLRVAAQTLEDQTSAEVRLLRKRAARSFAAVQFLRKRAALYDQREEA